MRQTQSVANQPELISPRTFRTKAERLNFIRVELDRVREERRLRKSGRRLRPTRRPPGAVGVVLRGRRQMNLAVFKRKGIIMFRGAA
jgi:hypothetical protein